MINHDTLHAPSFSEHTIPEYFQNWIELSQSAVNHNAVQFKQWLGPNTEIIAVIKSNAYGHGLVEMAQLYDACKDIRGLCVINLSEAVQVRKHGIKKSILVIGYLDLPHDTIIQHDIEVVLYDAQIALALNSIGKKYNTKIKVHIKFDSGMHRLGIMPPDLQSFMQYIQNLSWISIVSIFTHFAQSYDSEKTLQQEMVFEQALAYAYSMHASNSHGVWTTSYQVYNFARIGIGLYGYAHRQDTKIQDALRPVLSLKSKILQVKQIKAGDSVGYDGMFTAPTDMTIGIIAMGYYEGIDARLAGQGFVLIDGQRAPMIGRICMNLTIIDVSPIPHCKPGQIVTVLGIEGKQAISVYDWSALTKASVYNHLTKLAAFLPKIIVA